MRKQVFNPFLPLNEYIPDGEPHVFGNRVYLYGSHDKEAGDTFCMRDYCVYSASITDLKNWKYEGISYEAKNDPNYKERPYMYAPDCVKGNDGYYYLYYAMSGYRGVGGYFGPISVAKSDKPYGPFKFIGFVKYSNGDLMLDYVPFDPAVMNDNGVIRLYYGTQYDYEENLEEFLTNDELITLEANMFGKTKEEIIEYAKRDSVNGAVMAILEDDMITIKEAPHHIIPYNTKGTSFEAHPFFEGSSIRKFNNKYYFIYSSKHNHELCYAISDYPDKDFKFMGTLVSNGDIGLNRRKEENRLNMTGTTHGSIEFINGKYYIFYHRLTHKSDYSRQACAEEIKMNRDGTFNQVEITSCGLNGKALEAKGKYSACIACNITNGKMPHGSNKIFSEHFPNVNNDKELRFISEITDKTLIGFKYFDFNHNKKLSITYKGLAHGFINISNDLPDKFIKKVKIMPQSDFTKLTIDVNFLDGVRPLYLYFEIDGLLDLLDISFNA